MNVNKTSETQDIETWHRPSWPTNDLLSQPSPGHSYQAAGWDLAQSAGRENRRASKNKVKLQLQADPGNTSAVTFDENQEGEHNTERAAALWQDIHQRWPTLGYTSLIL